MSRETSNSRKLHGTHTDLLDTSKDSMNGLEYLIICQVVVSMIISVDMIRI